MIVEFAFGRDSGRLIGGNLARVSFDGGARFLRVWICGRSSATDGRDQEECPRHLSDDRQPMPR